MKVQTLIGKEWFYRFYKKSRYSIIRSEFTSWIKNAESYNNQAPSFYAISALIRCLLYL